MNSLRLVDLSVDYSDRILLEGVNLDVTSGMFQLITGSNGIGKTSLLRSLAGLSPPYKGEIFWNGKNIYPKNEEFVSSGCYLGHRLGIKMLFSVEENLLWFSNIYDVKVNIDEILYKISLSKQRNILAKDLSAGQKKLLAFSRFLLKKYKLWILDELFASVDSKGVIKLIDIIKAHINNGGMVVATSHQNVYNDACELSVEKFKTSLTKDFLDYM